MNNFTSTYKRLYNDHLWIMVIIVGFKIKTGNGNVQMHKIAEVATS